MLKLYENIRFYRKQAKLTQNELATLVGYTDRSSIAKIEKGLVDIPQTKIKQFADIFGITPSTLMGSEEKEKPDEYSGLTDSQKALMDFAKSVPDDKAELILRVMRSILEDER